MPIYITCLKCGFSLPITTFYDVVKRGHERCINCGREFRLSDAVWVWDKKPKEVMKDGKEEGEN
jgi:DNA-directed RNA polymerase subunit RPC12/RpoP